MNEIVFDIIPGDKRFFIGGPVELGGKKVGTVTKIEHSRVYCKVDDDAYGAIESESPISYCGVATCSNKN
jgi:hypothetical protein